MKRRSRLRFLVLAPMMGIVAGCAETPLKIPPPSNAARAQFGDVGVVSLRVTSSGEELRDLGANIAEGAQEGATEGVIWAFEPAGEACRLFIENVRTHGFICTGAVLYGIVAAPFAAVTGAIRSHPAREVEAAEETLLAAFNRIDPRTALRDKIVIVGESTTDFRFHAIEEKRQSGPPRADKGYDTILALYFEPFLIFDDDNMNPGVTLDIKVEASLVRAKDGARLHTQIWRYWSENEKFFDLTENDGDRFKAMTAMAYQQIAKKIVYDLFVASTPEVQNSGQRGIAWAVDSSAFYNVAASTPTPGTSVR